MQGDACRVQLHKQRWVCSMPGLWMSNELNSFVVCLLVVPLALPVCSCDDKLLGDDSGLEIAGQIYARPRYFAPGSQAAHQAWCCPHISSNREAF